MNQNYDYIEYGGLYANAGSCAKLYGLYLLVKVNETNIREFLK